MKQNYYDSKNSHRCQLLDDELEGGRDQQQSIRSRKLPPGVNYDPIEESDRAGFIRKVYGILSVQLMFTAFFSAICMFMRENEAFVSMMVNPTTLGFILFLYIATACALLCCGLDKAVPWNYLLLCIFTFSLSWLVGIACMRVKNPLVVVEAATLTSAMVIGLTFYAIRTDTDFTMCGQVFFALSMVLLTASIFAFVWGPQAHLFIALGGVILFSLYLIQDTQMIVGGEHKQFQFDKDSYIIAAVVLYLDIINMFLYVLSLLQGEGEGNSGGNNRN